ncbi:MAG: serine/threonine protein kinase [Candidatus Aminicenantes bacterium]|nr:serine/threonine protein kinase [Candidatus Aminicenantes bacterium]
MADFPDIPGCEIIADMKEGGMATIYLGIQRTLNRKVAVKVLQPSFLKNEDASARFQREAKTAAAIPHSNIIQIFDAGTMGDSHYIVMEYLEESLRERLDRSREKRMHPEIALDIIETLVRALDYSHFRGILHRDIKPENIMFRPDSTPVLVDFGIARVEDASDRLTKYDTIMGTADYMSPEQCRAQRDIDGRTDMYSLGIVLFEMLAGKRPFGGGQISVAIQHIEQPIPELPEPVRRYQPLVNKMMAKDREERLANAPEFDKLFYDILTT